MDPLSLRVRAGIILAALLIAGSSFWFGGYHPRHWLVLAIITLVAYVLGLLASRVPTSNSAAFLAGGSVVALGIVALLSMEWAWFSRHLAWDEANRMIMYGVAILAASAWLQTIRSFTAFYHALTLGYAGVGIVTLVRLYSDEPIGLFLSGRLSWPVDYPNGTAALFVVAMWLAIGAAISMHATAVSVKQTQQAAWKTQYAWLPDRQLWMYPVASGAFLVLAVLALGLAILTQSRGAALALVISIVAAFVVMRQRAILTAVLGVLGGAFLLMREAVTQPLERVSAWERAVRYDEADPATLIGPAEEAVRTASSTILVAAAMAGMAMAIISLGILKLQDTQSGRRLVARTGRGLTVMAVLVVVAVAAFNASALGDWGSSQVDACGDAGAVAAQQDVGGNRLREVGSNRCDFWRVAYNTWEQNPIKGFGANNFRGAYLLAGTSTEQPTQAHSLPMDVLMGLGLIGAGLMLVWVLSVGSAVGSYVRSGHKRDAIFGASIAVTAYWMVHASVDWIWNLPAITLGVMVLIGGLMGVLAREVQPVRRIPALLTGGVVAVAVGVLFVPQLLADREWREARNPGIVNSDPEAAIGHAETAADWDPTWGVPLAYAALLYATRDEDEAAESAIAEAIVREPNNWTIRVQAISVLSQTRSPEAEATIQQRRAARDLNPAP